MAKGGGGGGGSGGTVALKFGSGNDTIKLAPNTLHRTTIDGGRGSDTLDLTGTTYSVRLMLSDMASDPSRLWIDPSFIGPREFAMFTNTQNVIRGSVKNVENVLGGSGDDWLSGTQTAANLLDGGAGADSLYVAGFGDRLVGGLGADFLEGGNDAILTGGVAGGGGDGTRDMFRIVGVDSSVTITDFEPGMDALQFVTIPGQTAFHLEPADDGASVRVRIDGRATSVLLTGVTPTEFTELVQVQYYMSSNSAGGTAVLSGGAGDDFYFPFVQTADYLVVDGDDLAANFSVESDFVVIADGATIAWAAHDFNGRAGVLGSIDENGDGIADSTIGLLDVTMASVAQIQVVSDVPAL